MPPLVQALHELGLSPWEAVLCGAVVALFWMVIAGNRKNARDREKYHAETRDQLAKAMRKIRDLERRLVDFYNCPHVSCPMRRLKPDSAPLERPLTTD